jgi:hypothetical protein
LFWFSLQQPQPQQHHPGWGQQAPHAPNPFGMVQQQGAAPPEQPVAGLRPAVCEIIAPPRLCTAPTPPHRTIPPHPVCPISQTQYPSTNTNVGGASKGKINVDAVHACHRPRCVKLSANGQSINL